jgi:hypothetical protein
MGSSGGSSLLDRRHNREFGSGRKRKRSDSLEIDEESASDRLSMNRELNVRVDWSDDGKMH